jgi:hypothetical protein
MGDGGAKELMPFFMVGCQQVINHTNQEAAIEADSLDIWGDMPHESAPRLNSIVLENEE